MTSSKTVERFKTRMRFLEKAEHKNMERTFELAGLKVVLPWLDGFMEQVDKEDAESVFHSFVQLGVCPKLGCDCEYDVQEGSGGGPVSIWLHKNHTAYNRAVWQVISSKPGLIEGLRQEIRKDLDNPAQTIEQLVYGQTTSQQYARQLLACFIKEKPSRLWVGIDKER